MNYAEAMTLAYLDEKEKLASCNSSTRKGKKPIGVAKLVEKRAAPIFSPQAAAKLRSSAPALVGIPVAIGAYEKVKSEGKKYRMGRAVYKQMKQRK